MKKNSVIAWSLVVAMGGFLFGFDTAVISGAEKAIQAYWKLNVFEHGLTVSIVFSFPYLSEIAGGENTFMFFSVMMMLQLLFVWRLMPETKGKSLEKIETTMGMH